ncbi:MAG TPA: SRPBCC family protein, partial [Kofleriaceae bacterium]|nr:SRPBCC family protein [Kofleriaceae bacterium]
MANLKIEERVVIAAPVDAVWRFLLDPERVVQCLPGAAYDSKESDNVFLGHMKVKVGPVTTLFAGKATMSEIDEVARSLRITGEGKDKNGAGTAKMVMLGKVTEVPGGAELSIDAEVDIAGKLVTFGRGLIKSVSAQLFKQFSARAQELLTEPAADSSQAAPEAAIEGAAEAAIEGAAEGAEPSAEAPAQASAEAPAQASAE